MATLSLYLSTTDISAGVLDTLATSAPSSLDIQYGWTADKNASAYSVYYPNTVRAANTFGTEPSAFSAYGFRTTNVLNCDFAAGTWSLTYKVKNNNYYATGAEGQLKFRLWRSANADGSSATQITSGWVASANIDFTANAQTLTGTITSGSLAAVSLRGQYLFLELEWYAITSFGNNSAVVYLGIGEGTNEALTSTTITYMQPLAGTLAVTGGGSAAASVVSSSGIVGGGTAAATLVNVVAGALTISGGGTAAAGLETVGASSPILLFLNPRMNGGFQGA